MHIMKEQSNLIQILNSRGTPKSWQYCFNATCPMKEDCLRFITGTHLPKDRLFGPAIYPTAIIHGQCQFFKQAKVIKGAWGFKSILHDVKAKDIAALRQAIKNFVGSNGSYYKYNNGQRLLTPEQQATIIQICKAHNYHENLTFDHYVDCIDF